MSLKQEIEESLVVFANVGIVVQMIDDGTAVESIRSSEAFNKLYEFCIDHNLLSSIITQ